MSVLTRFTLDGGTNSAAARRLLPPEGLIRRAVNFRLRRDNEYSQRPGFTALDMGVYGEATATLQAYDLMAYGDRLCALGALSDATTVNGFYEYVGGAEGWRKVLEEMPDATCVRLVAGSPDRVGAIKSATCAARGGYLLVTYDVEAGSADVCIGHLVRVVDSSVGVDQTLVIERFTQVVTAPIALVTEAGTFHVVGANFGASALTARSITAATDEAFSANSTLQTIDSNVFAAAAVLGAPGGYVTVGTLAGDLVVRHYNDSHAQQMTRTITAVSATYVAIHANGPQNDVTVAYVVTTTGAVVTHTIALDTGLDISGPNSIVATGGDTSRVSVRYEATTSSSYRLAVFDSLRFAQLHSVTAAGVATAGSLFFGFFPGTELAVEEDATAGNRYYLGYVWGDADSREIRTNGLVRGHATLANQSLPLWFQDFGTAALSTSRLCSLTRDSTTGRWYSTALITNNDLETGFVCYEWKHGTKERRQSAVAANQLHVAGGVPLVFDGRQLVEMGFGLAPFVHTLAESNGSGSVTPGSDYFIQLHSEYVDALGNVHRGPPSLVFFSEPSGGEDTITFTALFGPSLRAVTGYLSGGYRGVSFRTAALADGSPGENLLRETYDNVDNFTHSNAFSLLLSDDALRALGETTGVIYTQSQTPIPHQAPLPCRYLWPLNERVGQAGLPRREQWLGSKLRFPSEAIHFSDADLFGFQGAADEAILGLAALGGQPLAFTRRSVQLWQGVGPDHSGSGEFSFAGFVSRQGGLLDEDGWRSLCETDEGTFFQRSDDQICVVKGGAVEWVGQAIRDELDTYPNVVAAVYLEQQHAVAFALRADGGGTGEIALYDLRKRAWFLYDVHALALAEHQGRLAYVDSAGVVYLQDAAEGTGAMPTQVLDTFDFDFGTGQSWGEAIATGAVGDYRGDATLALSVTYDSGANYSAIDSWAITAANGYTSAKPFSVHTSLPDRRCARFGLRWTVSGSSGSAGLRINEITLETDTMPGIERRPSRDT